MTEPPPCFIEGCDKPARTGVLLRPDQGGGVTYRCDEHLTSFGTDSWKCGSDTPPHPEPVADGCNLCGCVWDEEGYCACDRAVLNDEPAWEDDDV